MFLELVSLSEERDDKTGGSFAKGVLDENDSGEHQNREQMYGWENSEDL